MATVHVDQASGVYPSKCMFPSCSQAQKPEPPMFSDTKALSSHLSAVHKLNTREARQPYLPVVLKSKREWVNVACPKSQQECGSQLLFSRPNLLRHLKSSHKMSNEEAATVINSLLETMPLKLVDRRKRKVLADGDMNEGPKNKK